MRIRLKEAGKKGYLIYALCDELREESEAKDKQNKDLLLDYKNKFELD